LEEKEEWTLREIEKRLQEIYCSSVGLESMHILNTKEKKWLMQKIEELSIKKFSIGEKMKIFEEINKN
jgi:2-oxoglutarate dehydrogenase E1 component